MNEKSSALLEDEEGVIMPGLSEEQIKELYELEGLESRDGDTIDELVEDDSGEDIVKNVELIPESIK